MTPEERACRYLGIKGEKPGWVSIEHDPIVQQLANEIREAIAQARAEALQEAVAAAESEPEPDDDVPDLTDYSKEELVRGTVRSTKQCIIERLRSLPGAQG